MVSILASILTTNGINVYVECMFIFLLHFRSFSALLFRATNCVVVRIKSLNSLPKNEGRIFPLLSHHKFLPSSKLRPCDIMTHIMRLLICK